MKEFSFIHTADWHFGANRNLIPNSEAYLKRQEAVFDDLIAQVKKLKPDFMLVAGDLFEDSGTTIKEFLLARRVFTKLGQLTELLVTDGNHDETRVGEFQSENLRELDIPGVTFSMGQASTVIVRPGAPVKVLAVRWTGIKDQDEFDKLIMDNLQLGCEIVMLHECFKGSMGNNGRRFPGGIVVPDIPGVKYYACGDIHIPQQVNLKHAWFSGAPMQFRFDDDPKKGFLYVEKHSDKPDYIVEFKPLKCPIEMRIVHDAKLVDPDAPIWYSLYCAADRVPVERPKNLLKINPQPVQIEIPEHTHDDAAQPHQIRIDYAEGVDQVMGELGYNQAAIDSEMAEVRKIAQQ